MEEYLQNRPRSADVGGREMSFEGRQWQVVETAIQDKAWWYRNCKRQRKNKAKVCNSCPFRWFIEAVEKAKKEAADE